MTGLALLLLCASSWADPGASAGGSQRVQDAGSKRRAEYEFAAFGRPKAKLVFELEKAELAAYESGYGYSAKEIAALKTWRDGARREALAKAVAARASQADLDTALAAIQRDYQRKLTDYLSLRRFRRGKDSVVQADIPRYVRDGAPRLNDLARQLDELAKRGEGLPSDLVDAAASFTQTALIYREPPSVEGDLHTGGVLPPLSALARGWGDCDTKSALMGAILAHWPGTKVLGVAVPGHYLLAVLGVPSKGDMFVEHEGAQYVLVEPAGPARLPPGTVTEDTARLLERADAYRLEPF